MSRWTIVWAMRLALPVAVCCALAIGVWADLAPEALPNTRTVATVLCTFLGVAGVFGLGFSIADRESLERWANEEYEL